MSPMLEDMQDMLLSATSRNRVWDGSREILVLRGKKQGGRSEVGGNERTMTMMMSERRTYLSRQRN